MSPTAARTGDRWIKCISAHGNIRGVAIQATQLIRSLTDLHKTGPQGSTALGEAVMGAVLLASHCKEMDRINLNIQASGTVKQALVDAYPDGGVRGYVIEPGPDEVTLHFERQGPWGTGLLSVLKAKSGEGEQPYIGTVPLVTGHLAKDLTYYWAQSEQIPSAVGLAVALEGGHVKAAGGFLVQAMPGAEAREIEAIERHIHEINSLAAEVAANSNPLYLLSQIFQDSTFMIVEERPLEFRCNCSWEKVNRALTLVGAAELKAMLAEDQSASVRCDFCTKEYLVDAAGLQKLIDRAGG